MHQLKMLLFTIIIKIRMMNYLRNGDRILAMAFINYAFNEDNTIYLYIFVLKLNLFLVYMGLLMMEIRHYILLDIYTQLSKITVCVTLF